MRMLLHNGTDALDVEVFWQSPTCMKLSVRWPNFMTDARQPTGCLTQEDVFGKSQDPFENEIIQFMLNFESIQSK